MEEENKGGMMDREDLNAMLWDIADPDKPGVEEDIEEVLTLFDRLKMQVDDLQWALEEERYGEDI